MGPMTTGTEDNRTAWQKLLPAAMVAATALLGIIALHFFNLNRDTAVPPSWASPGGVRNNTFEWVGIVLQSTILSLTPAVLGYLIVRQRPAQRIGRLLLVIALTGALMTALQELMIYDIFTAGGLPGGLIVGWITNWLWIVYFAMILFMLAVFPNGRFLSRSWRAMNLAALLLYVVPLFIYSTMTTPMASAFQVPNPFFSFEDAGLFRLFFNFGLICMLLAVFLVLIQIVDRYRQSRGRERQQMKWLLAGMTAMALMVLIGGILSTLGYVLGDVLISFSVLAPLLGIGVALLRYRLYDIDIIIRRSLVYGLLTAILIAVYFGVVVLSQTLFVALTGQESPIAIVISTLLIAALFNPLRARLQEFIDRRFYRRGYDAAQTLAHFAQTARSETNLETLSAELARVVGETMQPHSLDLWLASRAAPQREAGE